MGSGGMVDGGVGAMFRGGKDGACSLGGAMWGVRGTVGPTGRAGSGGGGGRGWL